MSVAVARFTASRGNGFRGYIQVKREIIRSFSVWDRQTRSRMELPAGMVVSGYNIVRGATPADEPYQVEFQSSGKDYSCSLHTFLPRTQAVDSLES